MDSIKYLTVDHLSTKDLIRIFSKISTHNDLWFNETPCWIWCGNRTVECGYGHIKFKRHTESVHRMLFAWLIHSLPRGRKYGEIDHLCKIRACCNPLHLEFVDSKTNVHRSNGPAAVNAKKTHCINGHLLSGPNLVLDWAGKRQCRTCQRSYQRQYQRDHPEQIKTYTARWRDKNREILRQRQIDNRELDNARHRIRYHYLKSIGIKPH